MRAATFCALLPLLLAATPAPPQLPALEDSFQGVERVVAVGDVHGDVDALKDVLKLAGLIDARARWVGGKAHLVQTGDIADRGDHTRAVFDLFMRLEAEARAAGGRVHVLLGNHEVMNMLGDLRYVTRGELASFADQAPVPDAPGAPQGLEGHRAAYGPQGRYGRWLRSRPAVLRINDTLFLHGGIAPTVPARTLSELNRWVHEDLRPGVQPGAGGVHPEGPLWFRGYALEDEATLDKGLSEVLARFGARRMVMGHTVQKNGRIGLRFGGRAVFIDTGMSSHYGRNLAALEIRGKRLSALYPDGRVELLVTAREPATQARKTSRALGK